MDFLSSIFRTSALSETGLQAPRASSSSPREGREADQQLVNAQAACWLFETTSDLGDQVSTVQFIPTLDKAACALVFSEDTRTWRRFVTLTKEAFEAWQSQPSQRNQYVVELFGVALLHVPLPLFPGIVRDGNDTELPTDRSGSPGDTFLRALEMVSAKYPNHKPEDEECLIHIAVLTTMISNNQSVQEYRWVNSAKLLLDGKNPDIAETLLGLWAIVVSRIVVGGLKLHYHSRIPEKIMQIGEDK
ncbi:hypothetical protein FS837_005926 [Tulasnella sp. UAMH 9824]|nr:hypothetical protein FS837_005926 [Tulasnella sp. UAMH 9824]